MKWLILLFSLNAFAQTEISFSPIVNNGANYKLNKPADFLVNGLITASTINPSNLTAGSVPFYNGSILTQDNANLFWDNSNKRLGVGVNSGLTTSFTVSSAANTAQSFKSTGTNGRSWEFQSAGGNGNAFDGTFQIIDRTANAARMTFDTTGNVGVGTTAPRAKIDITTDGGAGSNLSPFLAEFTGTNVFNNARLGQFFAPNNPTGSQVLLQVGNATGNNNSVFLGFNNAGGSGSATNYGFISLFGASSLAITGTGKVGIGTTSPLQALDLTSTGAIRTAAVVGSSSTPTVAYGTGAGTGPVTNALVGTQTGGYIQFTTGTVPAVGTVFTLTFPIAPPNFIVPVFQATNAASAGVMARMVASTPTSTTVAFASTAIPLTASTNYQFYFITTSY